MGKSWEPIDEPWNDEWTFDEKEMEIHGRHVHHGGCAGDLSECEDEPRVVVETDGGIYAHANDLRLMAAAPDLYRALDMAFKLANLLGEDGNGVVHRALRRLRPEMDAALRKARGEQ